MAPKGGAGFRRLGAYILDVKSSADPVRWKLGTYILDAEHGGAKVGWAKATNCGTNDLGWATKAIIAHNARNTRARADKNIHFVVSFPKGEAPTREQLEDIEEALCEAIGLERHMRLTATHTNTSVLHMHIGISRICPDTLRALHPHKDFYRLQAACAELEVKHGLTLESHSRDAAEAAVNETQRRAVREQAPQRAAKRAPEFAYPRVAGRQSALAKPHPAPAHERSRHSPEERYRHDLARARAAQDKAMRELRIRHARYARELYEYHSRRLREEQSLGHRGHLRRDGFAHLAEQRRKDRAERLAREAEERRQVLAAHPLPQWKDYRAQNISAPASVARTHPMAHRARDSSQGAER